MKHVSFAHSIRNKRIRALQLNKCVHVKLKCKCLENAGELNEAEISGKKQKLAKIIVSAKSKRILSFTGIEQGSGRNKNHTCAYFKEYVAVEAREWIMNMRRKVF